MQHAAIRRYYALEDASRDGSVAARREPLMPHGRYNRSAWFCPNGHPDWQRPTAEQIDEQGENLELECGDCGARWKADADQRAILRRYHDDKVRKPPASQGTGTS